MNILQMLPVTNFLWNLKAVYIAKFLQSYLESKNSRDSDACFGGLLEEPFLQMLRDMKTFYFITKLANIVDANSRACQDSWPF